jgi:hypothetical protein
MTLPLRYCGPNNFSVSEIRDANDCLVWWDGAESDLCGFDMEQLVMYANMMDKIRDLVFFSLADASDVLDDIEAILKG